MTCLSKVTALLSANVGRVGRDLDRLELGGILVAEAVLEPLIIAGRMQGDRREGDEGGGGVCRSRLGEGRTAMVDAEVTRGLVTWTVGVGGRSEDRWEEEEEVMFADRKCRWKLSRRDR